MSTQETHSGLKAREAAIRILMAVTLKNRPFDIALDDITKEAGLGARDRAFVMNLVMLTLRRLGGLKALLASLLERGLPRNATWTEAALVTGLAQILLMRTADHAAVNETVTLVKNLPGKERGFAGLVNAVLRRAAREQEKLQAILNDTPERDLPNWIAESWTTAYGQDGMRKIAASLQSNPALDISLNPGENIQEWAEKLDARVMPNGTLRRTLTDVTQLPGYEDGIWWVQDLAASLPVMLLGDVAGKHILDMCAAPGGKTMQLASQGATVTAIDRNKNRLKRLVANLERTKLKATVVTADAAKCAPETPADAILLDAPCSATGTLRRNPDVIWTKAPEDVAKLTALQARILDHAFGLLPAGGTLVYCVCSLEPSEGREQIDAFLTRHSDASRSPVEAAEIGGISEVITADGDLLCLPSLLAEEGGMDGFFAARLKKIK
ncbi:MAG: 16S rRNA (cytosine(967)-C(5))-methyltransferase RsmB [Alphaproteobacteria bacterium]|nr:16S rRNA (cytosine(967)-C(5))-methyltransferase RsmB [Alphaproteobacteria bacterium]